MLLRDRIMRGQFRPGDRLYEVEVSKALGMSRTPLRQVLASLAHEGLLERRSGGGFVVRKFTLEDACDAIELRGLLEGTVARRAAEQGPAETALAAMRSAVEALDRVVGAGAEALDFSAYTEFNAGFHKALAGLATSSILAGELARVLKLPFASPSAFLQAQANVLSFRRTLITAQSQHQQLLEAIQRGEGMRAEFIAREHAHQARANLETIVREDPGLAESLPGWTLFARNNGRDAATASP